MLDAVKTSTHHRLSRIPVDAGFRADVQFWLDHLRDWDGTSRWRSCRVDPFVIATDASLNGFGYYIESIPSSQLERSYAWPHTHRVGATFSGSYSEEHAELHTSHTQISWCELLAVLAALHTYAPLLRDQCVLFLVDNEGDVAIINRQATRNSLLADLLRRLYTVSLAYNITVKAKHRPGVDNVLADFLSRPEFHQHHHVARWSSTHPLGSARLSSVSLVCSGRFID